MISAQCPHCLITFSRRQAAEAGGITGKLPQHDEPFVGKRRRRCGGSRSWVQWYGEVVPKVRQEVKGKPCRACGERMANRPRQLCWGCYYAPGVRDQFPSTSKHAHRGVGDADESNGLPEVPTAARPGSPEKVAELEQRAAAGVELFHPADLNFRLRRAECG